MNKLKRREKIAQRRSQRRLSEGELISPRRVTTFLSMKIDRACIEPWEDMEVCIYCK